MRYPVSILSMFILLLTSTSAIAKSIDAKSISEKLNKEVVRIAKDLGDLLMSNKIPVYTSDSMIRVIEPLPVNFKDSTTRVLGLYVIYQNQTNPGNAHQSSQIYGLSPYLAFQQYGIELLTGYGFISFKDWQRHASKEDIQLVITLANLLSGTSTIQPQFPIEEYQYRENDDITVRRNYWQDDKKVLLTQFNTEYLGQVLLNRAQEVFDQLKKKKGSFYFDSECVDAIPAEDLANHLAIDEVSYTNTEHSDSIVSHLKDLSFFRYPILLAYSSSLGFMMANNPKSAAFVKKEAFYSYLSGWEKDLFAVVLN